MYTSLTLPSESLKDEYFVESIRWRRGACDSHSHTDREVI